MFEFLAAVQKLTAAREVFNKLPVDSIDIIYRNWHLQVGSHEAIKKKNNYRHIKSNTCTHI